MKQILVATDLSVRSAWATERALHLAGSKNARVVVVHVTDPNVPRAAAAVLHVEAQKVIEGQIAAPPDSPIARPQVRVVEGRPVESIVATAADISADLIVIGQHERHPLLDLFRGSTGERVLRLTGTPVLVVSKQPSADYRRVLLGLDFSMPSRLALEYAARHFSEAEFHAVHAWDMPEGVMTSDAAEKAAAAFRRAVDVQVAEYLAGLPAGLPRPGASTYESSPTLALRESVARLAADLLVLGTHGRTGMARATIGSVTEDLLKDPPCDVLAVRGW